MTIRFALAVAAATLLGIGCGGCEHGPPSALPAGTAAYDAIPATVANHTDELLRPGDQLSIRVLGEPELTSDQYHVDGSGYVQLPLTGDVLAAGRKPSALRDEIARRLAARYIRDPQVAVIVLSRAKATFAVEGQVKDPGLFDAQPDTTLLSAVAQAKSPTDEARLDDVAIFRTTEGKRLGARFDLKLIRAGLAPDPQIVAGDTVVVGYSANKGAWHDFLKATPLLSIFYLIK
ncbi:MAG: polysaccharide export protein [Novosphingobium sp.]|nr:polysaccharide export protein [Novosphingobium sp.]